MFDTEAPAPAWSDVLDAPDQVAAELANPRPAPGDAVTLSLLDPGVLSGGGAGGSAGRVGAAGSVDRGGAAAVLASMAADPAAAAKGADRSWVREDVACALRLSGMTAQRRLTVARTLVEQLPATLALLDRGENPLPCTPRAWPKRCSR